MIIKPDNEMLSYSGRIDFDDRLAPVLVYACSSIGMKFTGTSLKAVIANHRSCWTNELGYFIDGEQKRFTLSPDEEKKTYTLAETVSSRLLLEGLDRKSTRLNSSHPSSSRMPSSA